MSKRLNNKRCVFPYCDFRGPNRFFKFPKDHERRKKWLEACNLNTVKDGDVICKKHFKNVC